MRPPSPLVGEPPGNEKPPRDGDRVEGGALGTSGNSTPTPRHAPSAPAALAAEINREHEAAFGKAREALEHAKRCGELLLQVKASVGHGQWQPWVAANCKFSSRTASGYMRLTSRWNELQSKSATAADLPLRDALALLTNPRQSLQPDKDDTLSDDEIEFIERLRAAGGSDNLAEFDRATQIQRRLALAALENLDAAIAEGLEGFSIPELRHAHECMAHCARILKGWRPEDIVIAVLARDFNHKLAPHLAECADRIRSMEAAA